MDEFPAGILKPNSIYFTPSEESAGDDCGVFLFSKQDHFLLRTHHCQFVGSDSICGLIGEDDDMWEPEGSDDTEFVEMLKNDIYSIRTSMGNKIVLFLVIKYDWDLKKELNGGCDHFCGEEPLFFISGGSISRSQIEAQLHLLHSF